MVNIYFHRDWDKKLLTIKSGKFSLTSLLGILIFTLCSTFDPSPTSPLTDVNDMKMFKHPQRDRTEYVQLLYQKFLCLAEIESQSSKMLKISC